MSKFDDLVTKLGEIFQIDRPELDLGIYRIRPLKLRQIEPEFLERMFAVEDCR